MRDDTPKGRITLSPELVALCERPSPKLGRETGVSYFADEDYRKAARKLLGEAGEASIWVFAYGSLLWRPAFDAAETLMAEARGWRRDFCMEIHRWRGSPEQPGLMLALRRGGNCKGLALRLPAHDGEAQLIRLLKREVDGEEDMQSLRWIDIDTANGPVRALACWVEPVESRFFVEKSLPEQAHMLARACGALGSGAAYLHQTELSLQQLGLTDDYVGALAEMVAEEIVRLRDRQALSTV